ncbi:MAG: hypothetical protein ACRD1W_01375 [Vicinamibacterales bacterium]
MTTALALVAALGAQATAPVPQPAIDGVIDALRAHQLVAITDPHGNAGMRDFLRRLVADPRFADTVNDIVLEVGNARYQALVDDYVNGAPVDEYALAEAWLNTTVPNQISADIELFRLVRGINAKRPTDRRLRLLLGDPPIDWSAVNTRADHFVFLAQRDSYPAALVQTQVVAKGRKALIIYGHGHFQRRNVGSNFEMGDWRAETIVSLIERAGPTRVFTIWHLEEALTKGFPGASRWAVPAMAAVTGTTLGALDVGQLMPAVASRVGLVDGKMMPLPKERYATLPIERQLDAVLYLGPAARSAIEPSVEPCRRPGFLEERLRRLALTGIPKFEAENIRKLCGAPAQ